MTDLAQRRERAERRRGSRSAPPAGGLPALYLRVALIPGGIVALLGTLTLAFLLPGEPSAVTTAIVLTAAAVLTGLVLLGSAAVAADAGRQLQRQVAALRTASSRGSDELRQLAEQAQRGEQAAIAAPPDASAAPPEQSGRTDPLLLLASDLQRERRSARQAVLAATAATAAQAAGQRTEVFVNLARRMQSLVHREIQLLDDLEAQVEDPDLLKGLFTVDHLATRMRRQSESLAVLGGAVSRRQWSRPVSMHEVLRASVAEVEQYSRVKVIPPVEGMLLGSVVADVIHLIAELVENATSFSAPHTQALLRAQAVAAGLVIEVEDRGLGMMAEDRLRLNELLADPARVSVSELLRDGRIGIFVVATLARRHGIQVQLQGNIYGGTQAIVVLPRALLEVAPARAPRAAAAPDTTTPLPRLAPPAPRASPWPGMAAEGRYAPAGRPPWDSAPVPAVPPADGRPPLPRRGTGQTHMAPELRRSRPPRHDAPAGDDHLPGLMAAFQQGVSRAAAEDTGPGDTDAATDGPR
jgi:hypothetical protein